MPENRPSKSIQEHARTVRFFEPELRDGVLKGTLTPMSTSEPPSAGGFAGGYKGVRWW